MTPELRAIADRFIYEQATLKHVLALATTEGLDRPVPGHEWTVRQLLGHLAESLHTYAALVEKWLAGEPPLAGWDPDAVNAETANRRVASSPAELLDVFGNGLNSLIAVLAAVPDEKMEEPLGPHDALQTLRVLGEHFLSHAIPLVTAAPEVRMDPLVLNWLLYAEFGDESSRAWQAELLEEAREYIANHPHEEDDE